MKKLPALLLVSSFFLLVQSHQAQTRARRAGQEPQPPSSNSPARPPVLGGANNPNSGQQGQSEAKPDSGPELVGEGDTIKVNTTLITIPVSVTDRDGRYIPDLRKDDFRIWEDNEEQQVAFFASVDKPFAVVLMLDTSGSTRTKLDQIQDAAITFVNQLRPEDRVMVVSFDEGVHVLNDFTNDRYRLRDAIRRSRPGEGTRLYDAVDMVINQKLNTVQGRKAIVLFTDGVDTTSKHASFESTIRDAEELDALIYPVEYDTYSAMGGGPSWPGSGRKSGIDILIDILGSGGRGGGFPGRRGGGGGGPGTNRGDYERGDRYLHQLADRSGARFYQADNQNLSSAFANVAEELRRQYSLGYYPKRPAQPGQRRQIKVRVNQPNLAVRTRDSYIFNPQPDSTANANPAQKSPPVLKRKLTDGF